MSAERETGKKVILKKLKGNFFNADIFLEPLKSEMEEELGDSKTFSLRFLKAILNKIKYYRESNHFIISQAWDSNLNLISFNAALHKDLLVIVLVN